MKAHILFRIESGTSLLPDPVDSLKPGAVYANVVMELR